VSTACVGAWVGAQGGGSYGHMPINVGQASKFMRLNDGGILTLIAYLIALITTRCLEKMSEILQAVFFNNHARTDYWFI